MADPLIHLAAGCALLDAHVEVERLGDGWREEVRYVVEDEGGCEGLELALPRDVHLRERAAVLRMSDDTKRTIDAARWELPDRGLDDVGVARLDVPEMRRRDRVVVDVVREWDRPDYAWYPYLDGARHASFVGTDAALKASQITAEGVASPGPDVRVGTVDRPTFEVVPPAVASQKRFTAKEAWARAAEMAWIPRGVDGTAPVAGDAALRRGAADDRGYAATVNALSSLGNDTVDIGIRGTVAVWDPDATVVPVWWDGDRPVLLAHPDDPTPDGPVWTPRGVVTPERIALEAPARSTAPMPSATRTIALEIPDGDPQATLYPGAGSAALTTETVSFDPADAARVWWIPIPAGAADLKIDVAPQIPSTTSRHREDGLVVVVGPSDERTTVTVSWRKPDAPTCGQVLPRAGEALEWTAQDPKGRIRTEGSWWSLTSHDGKPVMPDRASVVNGLDWRFARQSLPEPGLPLDLKGRRLDEALIGQMRAALLERVAVADLPGDPLWPRKLHKARKTEVLDPVEAALVLRLYAQQVRLPATWALARPADLGPGDAICPIGYEDALLAVEWEGQLRWVDPACSVCGTFEVRPQFDGASVYTSVAAATPEVTGRQVVRTTADGVAVGLQGPPALLLRLWLQDVAQDDRAKALAERFAGPGATLEKAEGIDVAGAPIKLLIRGGTAIDPLALPPAEDDGTTWAVWAGDRRAERILSGGPVVERVTLDSPAGPIDAVRTVDASGPVELDLGAVRYVRKVEDGRLVEILEVKDRRIPAEVRAKVEAARLGSVRGDAPAPFAGVLRDGTPVQVVGVRGEVARIGAGPSPEVPRADVQGVPFRARLQGKRATVTLRSEPGAAGKPGEKLPVAGEPVWITALRDGWARVDVEGPLGSAARGGWVEISAIRPEPQADVVALGDLPLSAWTPWTADRVVLDAPIRVRGLEVPQGAALHLGGGGVVAAVEILAPADIGGAALPAGSRLELAQACDFAVVPPSAVTIGGVSAGPQQPACLSVGPDGKLAP